VTYRKEWKNSVKQPTISLPKKASAHFKRGYNCAQSVLLTMQEHYNLRNELIPKIATAFGGGVGRCGSLCGALTGAMMAIGLKNGTNEPGMEKREKVYKTAQRFFEEFTKEFGTHFCRELIGYDLTNPEEHEKAQRLGVFDQKCSRFVEKAVEILITLES
jgi:C_GCAxxG_C_C family probable redox protein